MIGWYTDLRAKSMLLRQEYTCGDYVNWNVNMEMKLHWSFTLVGVVLRAISIQPRYIEGLQYTLWSFRVYVYL